MYYIRSPQVNHALHDYPPVRKYSFSLLLPVSKLAVMRKMTDTAVQHLKW